MRELRVKLPDLLHQRQINRKQLADATGIRYSTLSDAYTGKRQPSLGTLEIIMKFSLQTRRCQTRRCQTQRYQTQN
jgi:DNA-binding Xre family transcriptional regulator